MLLKLTSPAAIAGIVEHVYVNIDRIGMIVMIEGVTRVYIAGEIGLYAPVAETAEQIMVMVEEAYGGLDLQDQIDRLRRRVKALEERCP